MRQFLLSLLLLLIGISLKGQLNLEEELKNVIDSNAIYIQNGRHQIIKNAQNGDYFKNISILKYLQSKVEHENYYILHPSEERLLCFLAQDKQMFLEALKKENWHENKIQPPYDQLGTSLINELEKEIHMWAGWLDEQDLSEEEYKVYRLYLGQINFYQDKLALRKETHQFIKQFPESHYTDYVQNLFDDFFTGSMGFSFSGGTNWLMGDVSDLVDLNGFLSFEMDFFLNRFYWGLGFWGSAKGQSTTRLVDTNAQNEVLIYEVGSHASSFNAGFKFGYLAYKSSKLKIYPYTLFTGGGINIYDNSNNKDNLTLTDGIGLGGGLGFDYDLHQWMASDGVNQSINSHIGIRVNVGYEQVFSDKNSPTSGMLICNAGIVWWLGD